MFCCTLLYVHSSFVIILMGRAVGIGRGTGGAVPPNNLHKYAVLLITKVCHFKKNYVCPPPPPPICKNFYVCPPNL